MFFNLHFDLIDVLLRVGVEDLRVNFGVVFGLVAGLDQVLLAALQVLLGFEVKPFLLIIGQLFEHVSREQSQLVAHEHLLLVGDDVLVLGHQVFGIGAVLSYVHPHVLLVHGLLIIWFLSLAGLTLVLGCLRRLEPTAVLKEIVDFFPNLFVQLFLDDAGLLVVAFVYEFLVNNVVLSLELFLLEGSESIHSTHKLTLVIGEHGGKTFLLALSLTVSFFSLLDLLLLFNQIAGRGCSS